jgi:hypothetical protein
MICEVDEPTIVSNTRSTVKSVTINVVPSDSVFGVVALGQQLTLNDGPVLPCLTLASGNQIWSASLEAFEEGMVIPINKTTANGLVVSAVPPGVEVSVEFS